VDDEKKLIISRESFKPGDVLCREGAPCENIYLLLKGAIEITCGGNVIRIVDKEGTFVGDLSPLISDSCTNTLTAVENSECIAVPVAYLEGILQQNPEEGINLLGLLAGRILRKSEDFPDIKLQYEEMMLAEEDEQNFLAALRGEETIPRKIVLVASENTFEEPLRYHFGPMGFKVYYNSKPRTVVENLDGISPDMIVFNAADFPRHWKPLLKLLRERKSPEETIFILITGHDFPFEEAAKASYLRINAIIPTSILDRHSISQLEELVKRYKSISDRRKYSRLTPKEFERFALLFTHPTRGILVMGRVADISLEGCRFIPYRAPLIKDIEDGTEVSDCSLRIGGEVISVDCRICRTGEELGVEFVSFQEDDHQKLFKYLMERAEREMQHSIGRCSRSSHSQSGAG